LNFDKRNWKIAKKQKSKLITQWNGRIQLARAITSYRQDVNKDIKTGSYSGTLPVFSFVSYYSSSVERYNREKG
jgi:hypothetical protein